MFCSLVFDAFITRLKAGVFCSTTYKVELEHEDGFSLYTCIVEGEDKDDVKDECEELMRGEPSYNEYSLKKKLGDVNSKEDAQKFVSNDSEANVAYAADGDDISPSTEL
jgi:hypothetical protein